jgi:hypothetical protein
LGDFSLNWLSLSLFASGLAYSSYDLSLYCAGYNAGSGGSPGSGKIFKINPVSGNQTDYIALSFTPFGIATYGNYLYVCSEVSGNILKYNLDDSTPTPEVFYSNQLSSAIYALTFDSSGNLYSLYNYFSTYSVNKINPTTATVDMSFNCDFNGTVNQNFYYINTGLVCDSEHNIYISNIADTSDFSSNIALFNSSGVKTTDNYINASYIIPRGLAIQNNYLYSINSQQISTIPSTGGTVYKGVQPSCFNFDTKILCLNHLFEEEYIPIQNLKSGDLVKTYLHGYRRIDLIGKISFANNPNKWNHCMYKMVKTEENGLLEDLILTGGHSILVDSISEEEQKRLDKFGLSDFPVQNKIDNKYLLLASVSDEFIKLTGSDIYTCYHLVLETNGNDDKEFGIWANGILTETTSKNYFKTQSYTLL